MQITLGETRCSRENRAFHTERSVDDWEHLESVLFVALAAAALFFIAAVAL
jgi:hypothetical protein